MIPPPSPRPPLDRAGLDGLAGLDVVVVDEATSTNAVLAEHARAGAAEGLVVVAERQSAGRGRLDRSWQSPPGTSLTFSLLLRPDVAPASWPWLPLLSGHTLAGALCAEGHDAGVKWPNDVLVGDRKVAGILVERLETPAGPAAVLGIGLNVSMTADELPVPTATSLELAGGRAVDRTALLRSLLLALREAYDAWSAGGAAAASRLASSYARDCVSVGREVRVVLPDGRDLEGVATTVDASGHLVVRTHAGETVRVAAGDVVHARLAGGREGAHGG